MKKIKIIVVFFLSVALLAGCSYRSWDNKRPCDQSGSKWESSEKTIVFSVDENGVGIGKMTVGQKVLEIHIAIGPTTQICIYPLENVKGNRVELPYYERWIGTFKKASEFTATVVETTYFTVGEQITFYRLSE